jgi:hypothetical protein
MASGFVSPKKQLICSKKLSIANADALTAKMASIFSSIEDPRVERTRVHLLTDILIIGILSVIAGGKGREQGKSALHLVSAWSSEHRLVLGQVKVADKSNEITAIPALLELLDIAGCIITIDAMGTLSCDRLPNF